MSVSETTRDDCNVHAGIIGSRACGETGLVFSSNEAGGRSKKCSICHRIVSRKRMLPLSEVTHSFGV